MAVTFRHHSTREEMRIDLPTGATVEEAVRLAGIHPDTVLVIRGKDPVPGDEPVADGETLTLLRVVSGG